MKKHGYLKEYPIEVWKGGWGEYDYIEVDGSHRLELAKEMGMKVIPVMITNLPPPPDKKDIIYIPIDKINSGMNKIGIEQLVESKEFREKEKNILRYGITFPVRVVRLPPEQKTRGYEYFLIDSNIEFVTYLKNKKSKIPATIVK